MLKDFLIRIDRFLDLFERSVDLQERSVKLGEVDYERSKARDETQALFFQQQAEAAQNIASSSNAQTHISRRTAEAIERSIPPRYDGDP